jgi:Protein of unknown function (DUF1559)
MSATRLRVNVIVVGMIFLVGVGVLLPFIVRVKMAAAKTSCGNNLKQLGLAESNYFDTFGFHVEGTFPNAALAPEDRMSWCFALLPFIECDPTFNKTKRDKAWNDPENELLMVRWKVFVCPSRPDEQTTQTTSYLGLAGLGEDAATLPTNDPRSGLFGYERKVRLEEIKDGTANTISILESCTGGPWAQGGPGSVRGLVVSQRPYVGETQPFGSWRIQTRWPMKPPFVAVQAVLADGSVRSFSSDTSPAVLEAFATINGKDRAVE